MVGATHASPVQFRSMLEMLRFRHDPLGFLTKVAARGDLSRFGTKDRFVLVSHPDHVREVLVTQADKFKKGPALQKTRATLGEGLLTSEGDVHKRQRRIINPAFHATHVATYADTMVAFADRLGGRWRDGQTVDAHGQMTRLTLEIVAKTLFDAEVESDVDAIGKAMTASVELFSLLLMPMGQYVARLPLPRTIRFKRTWPALERTVARFIAEKEQAPTAGNDLMSILLGATDPEGGAGMTRQQLRDEAITLFTAGHETTANGLTYALHLVAHHPEVQVTLHREFDDVLRGRAPSASDLDRLPYTRAVVAEAMRVYPPVWTVGREVKGDVVVGGKTIRQGSIVLVSQWITHHDPRWWPDPFRFDPSRFLPGAPERPRYAYYPFAGGPRGCIGEAFAWLEMTLVVATILRKWTLTPVAPRELELAPSITLRPKTPVHVRLARR
jgi:cytochrome P450